MPMTDEELERIADLVCQRLGMVMIHKPLGVVELADFLSVEKSWVYGQKSLPHFWVGKHKRFMIPDVLDALGYTKGVRKQEVNDVIDRAA